jgi:predicted nucleotidyltransferase
MIPDERDLAFIVARIRSCFDATAVYLFGSQAKDSSGPGSDIDLLIVGPSGLPQARRGREVAAALAAFPTRFDLLFYTEAELAEERADPCSFISSALSGARTLFER